MGAKKNKNLNAKGISSAIEQLVVPFINGYREDWTLESLEEIARGLVDSLSFSEQNIHRTQYFEQSIEELLDHRYGTSTTFNRKTVPTLIANFQREFSDTFKSAGRHPTILSALNNAAEYFLKFLTSSTIEKEKLNELAKLSFSMTNHGTFAENAERIICSSRDLVIGDVFDELIKPVIADSIEICLSYCRSSGENTYIPPIKLCENCGTIIPVYKRRAITKFCKDACRSQKQYRNREPGEWNEIQRTNRKKTQKSTR